MCEAIEFDGNRSNYVRAMPEKSSNFIEIFEIQETPLKCWRYPYLIEFRVHKKVLNLTTQMHYVTS